MIKYAANQRTNQRGTKPQNPRGKLWAYRENPVYDYEWK